MRRTAVELAAVCLLTAAGCQNDMGVGTSQATAIVPIGHLSIDWTVGGRTDAVACDVFAVDELDVVVLDDHGLFFTSVRVPCDMFGIRIGLPEGDYAARAVLTQPGGQPATRELFIDRIVIVQGIAASADLDFTASLLL